MGRVRRGTPPPKGSLVTGSSRPYPVTRPSPERKSGGPIWGADEFGAGRTLVVRENDGPPRGRWPCPVVPIGRLLSRDEWRTDFGGESGGPTSGAKVPGKDVPAGLDAGSVLPALPGPVDDKRRSDISKRDELYIEGRYVTVDESG